MQGNDKLYAGPAWDYDGAFGEYLHQGVEWTNYTEDVTAIGSQQLSWWKEIAEDSDFISSVRNILDRNNDELIELFTNGVDEYAELIRDSVLANNKRYAWNDEDPFRPGTYQSWDSNVRYLQYFLCNRLNHINGRFDAGGDITWKGDGTYHSVSIYDENGEQICEISVADGEPLDTDLIPDLSRFVNGYWGYAYSGEKYSRYVPILEDCAIRFFAYEE